MLTQVALAGFGPRQVDLAWGWAPGEKACLSKVPSSNPKQKRQHFDPRNALDRQVPLALLRFQRQPPKARPCPIRAAIAATTGRANPIATGQRGQRASPPLTRKLAVAPHPETETGAQHHQQGPAQSAIRWLETKEPKPKARTVIQL